ncbi:fer-1-like protein 5 [Elgaria multicarinata webbii]|uniref:fer-1-like protein 5 n=1 Tax=Elgaria multicarinata webbii TaxID=159646 RepID=UPI002FCD1D55
MLRVVILSAHIPPEKADKPDTYVIGTFRDIERSTRIVQKEQDPVWNETLVWYLDAELLDSNSFAMVHLRDWSTKAEDRNYGFANIALAGAAEKTRVMITMKDQILRDDKMKPTGESEPEWTVTEKDVVDVPTLTAKKELTNKKQPFQVRVGIIECRQLQENNIKPVVKVSVGDHVFRTRIKLGNNPFYNEVGILWNLAFRAKMATFVQNFNETPLWLFDQFITIQVLNSRAIRADSIIGVFKIEIGVVYESPGHALIAKWLSLYDPVNLNAGLRGYVKVNLCVLGAGDHAPDTDHLLEDGDLESAILHPAAMPEARMATLQLQQHGDGSILGTTFISLSQISSTGAEMEKSDSGFQPCFGPAFLTLYGSPKEFMSQVDPLKKLNTGTEEGIAYRGRVLVELKISMEAIPTQKIDDIPVERIKKIEYYLPQNRYGLCAVLYSATMLDDIKERIQFEVSIGNYGNKFDGTCKPLASTTQYSHAVFDGNYYYYLPWYDTKPMMAIASFWENTSYRITSLNILQLIQIRLKKNLDTLKSISIPSDPSVGVVWKKLQKELVEDCRKPLPVLEVKMPATLLDQQMRKLRTQLLHQISKDAEKTSWKTPLQKMTAKAENWLNRITLVTKETQISMPDVMIWMLCDEQRVAYARVKSHTIMFSKAGPHATGRQCGKTQTIFLQGAQTKGIHNPIPALLRVRLWLGMIADSAEFMQCCEGRILIIAETYENQRKTHGIWGIRDLMPHPNFSDVTGQISLPKDKFQLPVGWKWDGEWAVEPQRRLLLDKETNHTEVMDEVYENQSRQPGRRWRPAPIPYSNVSGDPTPPKEEIVCPPGWTFVEDWKVEVNRAVDDAGWEYGVAIAPAQFPRSWNAAEKTYHTHRRRRWLRKRSRNLARENRERQMATFLRLHTDMKTKEEAWEYAPLYGWRFHLQRRSNDVFRRRCWRRKLIPVASSRVAAIFLLEGSLLRCYIYQAKDLVGAVAKGNADPVAQVCFLHMSQSTQTITGTLHPCWDQTLLFENVLIYGNPQATEQDPPIVAVEIFDYDGHSDYFMGRCLCTPSVYLDLDARRLPRLRKYLITREQKDAGQLLAAFELLLDKKDGSLGKHPPPAWINGVYTIPKGIRPILKLMAVEILAWGLRDMKNYNLLVINNPSLTIECGGESIQTPIIKNFQENPNFPISIYLMKVYLPVDEDYAPPIELKVLDHREFGYKPVVGRATVRSMKQYYCDPWEERKAHNLPARAISKVKVKGEEEEEEEVDWWSKYYVTMGDLAKSGNYLERGFDSMKIYNCELEEVPEFHGFQDFCQTFRLYRGRVKDEDPMVGGEFKGLFRIYPLPEDPNVPPPPRQFQELPENVSQTCLVRVYIIRAFNLQPKDRNGLCDPYIRIKLGKKKAGEREDYIPNTLEPVYGRMYELMCSIPVEKDLKITFYDFDIFPPDDTIGDTNIDLENRLLSRYGANCGLPQSYCVTGPSQWRDQLLPSELLENYVRAKNLIQPEINEDGSRAFFRGRTYQLSDFETKVASHGYLGPPKERLALHLLRTCGLVTEHIETRTLYNTAHPGIEQGKVQMWIDIFPESLGEPGPPFDITPRNPKRYELRCIIWNTKDVDLEDTNIFGDRMSDIYVKGWLDGLEEDKQKTDIHYRSLAGEGNFNWRFVFPMEYLPMEQICVLTKKQHFWSLDETMQKVPPKLIIQIWDNDKFSADDFLGSLEMNLLKIPRPAKRPRDCTAKMLLEESATAPTAAAAFPFRRPRLEEKHVSLFMQKNLRGWWPCIVFEKDKPRVSGKVEMTLELLTDTEAEERPAGKGRDEPNTNPFLKPPERPETSFLWFTAPLKSLHFIVWQKSKWKILIFFCIVLVIFLFATFVYSAPGYLAMKLINPMKVTKNTTNSQAATTNCQKDTTNSQENPTNSQENPTNSQENPTNSQENPTNSQNNPTNSQENTPNSQENTPNSQENTTNSQENTPNSQENTPNSQKNTPNSQENTTNFQKTTPNSQEVVANSKEAAANFQEETTNYQEKPH